MDKGFRELEIDEEFKNLIHPLRPEEYLQLEININLDGCREPIEVWNNVIVDGHNRYEICNRLLIPYAVRELDFASREAAIAWICRNQLGRRNISEETRRYLIGKQYEMEKSMNMASHSNIVERRGRPRKGTTYEAAIKTAQRVGEQYHVSHTAVKKYGSYSKAIDAIKDVDPSLSERVLAGSVKISQENIMTLAKMTPNEIRESITGIEDFERPFVTYKESRQVFSDPDKSDIGNNPAEKPLPAIKVTPNYDPDAELVGLALTIPTWINSIERSRSNSNLADVSPQAKEKMVQVLTLLKSKIIEILAEIQEDSHG